MRRFEHLSRTEKPLICSIGRGQRNKTASNNLTTAVEIAKRSLSPSGARITRYKMVTARSRSSGTAPNTASHIRRQSGIEVRGSVKPASSWSEAIQNPKWDAE